MSNLPEPVRQPSVIRTAVRHPSVIRAAVSPTAVAVTAAGVGIGVWDHSVILAVVLGAGAWCGRMAAAVINRARKQRAAMPRPAEIDPWSVPEPWRQLLHQAADAQSRFDQTLAEWPAGPLRDRLLTLQPRLWADVGEIGVVAHRGAALSGWTAGVASTGRPSAEQLAEQLRRVEAERRRAGPGTARDASLSRSEEAIAAQIRALHNAAEAEAQVLDRLRMVVARLDETVTSLLVLGAEGGEIQADTLSASLDEINEEITSLSRGLAEAANGPSAPLAMPSPPAPLPLARPEVPVEGGHAPTEPPTP